MRGHRADTIELLSSDWLMGCFSRGVKIRNENWFPYSETFTLSNTIVRECVIRAIYFRQSG